MSLLLPNSAILVWLTKVSTSTHLALVPASPLSVYSASKAALNAFVLCLREQIRNSSVKIIKLLPAVTQTELYDYMGQSSSKLGMLGDLSTEEAYKGLASGSDQVLVGSLGPPGSGNNIDRLYKDVIAKRRMAFDGFADLLWVPI